MSPSKGKDAFSVLGVGVAACAACCAGPVLAFLAATGLFTVVGVLVFGLLGLLALVPGVAWWGSLTRRRRQTCAAPGEPVPVTLSKRA